MTLILIVCLQKIYNFESTGAWNGIDTLANCNKVEHDKIIKYIGKLTQESKNFENLPTSIEVTS